MTTELSDNKPAIYLEALAEIGRVLMERNSIDDALSAVVSISARITGARVCSLLILDKTKQELILRACRSESGCYSQRSNTPLGKGIAGRVALSGQLIKVPNIQKDPRFINKKIAAEDGLVSLLSVPLWRCEKVIGVMNWYTFETHDFTDIDIWLLTTAASFAAILLINEELNISSESAQRELEERKIIERAKEIVMEKKNISGKQAFEMMRNQSMNTRMSMVKISESIILASAFD